MTENNKDILEEIKKRVEDYFYSGTVTEYKAFNWLIQEVEKLRGDSYFAVLEGQVKRILELEAENREIKRDLELCQQYIHENDI